MPLPPGRSPLPVAGINAQTDPELAEAAAELNAWIDYLTRPESHDGPRIYRERGPAGQPPIDSEVPRRLPHLDEQTGQYEVVPILDGFQADPGQFFRPAQAVSGISESLLGSTFMKLTEGCLTWTNAERQLDDSRGREIGLENAPRYPEVHPARADWMQMRKDFHGALDNAAHEYEGDFITYQVHTENGFYAVAEHIAKYQAIFAQAGKDITSLMKALTETFAKHNWYGGTGFTIDVKSVIITGLVAAVTTVISGGITVAKALASVVTELTGEAGKTAQSKPIQDHYRLREPAKQYLDAVTKIERDTAEAVKQLYESLRVQIDRIREMRQYEAKPRTGTKTQLAPHYRDYL
ncbi:hypothetical protein JOF56_007858 [Kibdelosporangium banguiense]|uniref:Uncharacterized protein n=1 Tax=Kibdelosporangium banguiense TaxID=1365924 RepID=A0ABS4TU23_9PSEU|nr:hypothetical protein [Kibdelosporangium banguiense]MBP2327473.1 hypothetical protein [Kibdelosporangium banguiense]